MIKEFIKNHFGSFEGLLIIMFMILLPVVYSNRIMDPVLYSRQLAYSIFLLILTLFVGVKYCKKVYNIQFNSFQLWFFIAVLVYAFWHFISIKAAVNKNEAFVFASKEASFLLGLFAVFILVTNVPVVRNILIKSVIIATTIFLAIGIYQLSKQDFSKFINATQYQSYYFTLIMNPVISTLANKNQFADYLYLTLPFSLYGIFGYKKFWRVYSAVVFTLSLTFIGLLISKSVWGSAGVFLLIIVISGALYILKHKPQNTSYSKTVAFKSVFVVICSIILGISLSVFLNSDIKAVQIIKDKIYQVIKPEESHTANYSPDNPSSAETRLFVWKKTLQMAVDNPVIGVGAGNWRLNLGNYGFNEFEHDIRQGVKNFMRPHNDILGKAAETGFVGLALFLFIYIAAMVIAFRNMLIKTAFADKVIYLGFFAMLVGYLIDLFVTFSRERISHNIIFIIVVVLIISDIQSKKIRKVQKPLNTYFKCALLSLVLIFSAGFIYVSVRMYKGEQYAREAYLGTLQKNPKRILRATRSYNSQLYTIDPYTIPVAYYRGNAYTLNNDYKKAFECYKIAHKNHPYNIRVLNNLATVYDYLGDSKTALKYYKEALRISPRYREVVINTAIIFSNQNQHDSALYYISQIPFDGKNTEKFDEAYSKICIRKAASIATHKNVDAIKKWVKDEKRIKSTFVKFQKKQKTFDEILYEDLTN